MIRFRTGAEAWIACLKGLSVLSVLLWLAMVVAVVRAIGEPFAGFLVEPNLNVSALGAPDWSGQKAGLSAFDRILAVEGQPIRMPEDLDRRVSAAPLGTPLNYDVLHDGKAVRMRIETQRLGLKDVAFSGMLLTELIGLFYLSVGIVTFWLRPRNPAAQAHLILTLSTAMVFASGTFMTLTHQGIRFHLLQAFLMGASFIHLALVFPSPKRFFAGHAWLPYLSYLPALLIGSVMLITYRPGGHAMDPSAVDHYVQTVNLYAGLGVLAIALFIGSGLYSALQERSILARSQARVVLLGSLASFVPFILTYLLPATLGEFAELSTLRIFLEGCSLLLFPFAVAWAIARHQAFDISFVVRKVTVYTAVTLCLAGVYALVSATGHVLVGHLLPSVRAIALPGFLAALAVAMAFRPLHDSLRRKVDRLFLGERADAMKALAEFSPHSPTDAEAYARDVVKLIERAFSPRWIVLQRGPQTLASLGDPEETDGAIRLPLVASNEIQGMLRIGPRSDGMPYHAEERALLDILAAHVGVTLLNVKLVDDRVRLIVQKETARSLAEERAAIFRQVIHDLRSDLFNITLSVHLAKTEGGSDPHLETIERSLKRIEDLLGEKSRWIREGRQPSLGSLRMALDQVYATMLPIFEQKAQRMELSRPSHDAVLPLSTVEFAQVLLNVLGNASKFSPSESTIRCEIHLENDHLVLSVEDEGPGIPPDFMSLVGSGKRADTSIPGDGLGLQNVLTLLERVNGTLTWENGERGATFTITLPAEADLLAR